MSTIVALESCLITIVNTLVILSIIVNRRLRSITNAFIVNLAIGDLTSGLVVIPLLLVTNLRGRTIDPTYTSSGYVMCQMSICLSITFLFASIFNLMAISLNYYISIFYPFRHEEIVRGRNVIISISVIWISSLLISILPFVGMKKRSNLLASEKGVYCQVSLNVEKRYLAFVCIVAAIPVTVMFFAYLRIFVVARRHQKELNECLSNFCTTDTYNKYLYVTNQSKAAKKILNVIGCFIICWAPLYSIMLIDVSRKDAIDSYIYAGAVLLAFLSAFLNSFVYSAMNKELRMTIWNIIRCRKLGEIHPLSQ